MSEQPKALRLADELEDAYPNVHTGLAPSSAAELRRLHALCEEMGEALREAVDLAWVEDSHAVRFDNTVLFGPHYDFESLDGFRRQEFLAQYECVVWPGRKWSAYCTYEGSMWFERFDSAEEAKEACMRLLDQVLPEHPAMKARAVLAKWKESK